VKTAITDLFGVPYPILNAGMGRVALPNMVAAVSEAGGLGVLGAGSSAPDDTRRYIREIRKLTDKPFGINCPLALPNAKANAQVALEEKVAVINYSMGSGAQIVKEAHKYGGKVIASVNSVHLAQRAEAHGADAVIAAGHEAAGHSGEITTFVLIPRLAEVLKIPIIAAGGVANGAGLYAALSLGASAVSMGTRFWTTQEGPMHINWKNKAVEMEVTDTIFSDKFDGIPCRQMKTVAAEKFIKRPLNLFAVLMDSVNIARELQLPYFKLMFQILAKGPKAVDSMMRMSQNLKMHTITITTGDLQTGNTAAGQSVGLVHDLPTIKEVILRLVTEAEETQRRMQATMTQSSVAMPTAAPSIVSPSLGVTTQVR